MRNPEPERPSHVLVGMAKDYEYLQGLQRTHNKGWWSSLKKANPGDITYFYVEHPHSAIVAVGRLGEPLTPTKRFPYRSEVENIRMLIEPMDIRQLKQRLPKWQWLKYPRQNSYVPPDVSAELASMAQATFTKQNLVEASVARAGAGFGSPEENKQVEQAACRYVCHHFKKLNYAVVSREKECLGYDFDVTNGSTTLHVEVKGISGSYLRFPITYKEVRCASDPSFLLALVTNVRTNPQLTLITGKEFLKAYHRRPIAFIAELRLNASPRAGG